MLILKIVFILKKSNIIQLVKWNICHYDKLYFNKQEILLILTNDRKMSKLYFLLVAKPFVALPTDRRTNIYRIDAHLWGESAQKK